MGNFSLHNVEVKMLKDRLNKTLKIDCIVAIAKSSNFAIKYSLLKLDPWTPQLWFHFLAQGIHGQGSDFK